MNIPVPPAGLPWPIPNTSGSYISVRMHDDHPIAIVLQDGSEVHLTPRMAELLIKTLRVGLVMVECRTMAEGDALDNLVDWLDGGMGPVAPNDAPKAYARYISDD